ncbi:hypothetical protein SUGI_0375490 [Cryptomeria japonica]|uniref:DELLA protein RGL1-like n=1 Tax=Cryptomeria japonica TaxID=3369 RepID=UPI002408A980|nr:DELLA protein RGL1-like [Cryptomeria japonica]GLJ20615.1 hypothetical protein SUGI_0375490 [Cryptomeria japonica]
MEDYPLHSSLDGRLNYENYPLHSSVDGRLNNENYPLHSSLDGRLNNEDYPLHRSVDGRLNNEDYPLHSSLDGRVKYFIPLECQAFPCIQIAEDQLHQEMNNENEIGQFGVFPSPPNIETAHEFSVGTAKYGQENATSSEEIVKVVGTQYMHACAEEGFKQNYTFAIPVVAREEQNGLQLTHLLLVSAEMVEKQRYEEAYGMLSQCKKLSSKFGNPIERLCYYFFEALEERIERQTCGEPNKGKQITPDFTNNYKSDHGESDFYSLTALCNRVLPYARILQFTTVKAILDAVGKAKRIHVIDLGIRTGCQWTSLIQSIALEDSYSSIKHLKITAIGVNSDDLEDSGRRLTKFAKAMEISFSYCSVKISALDEIEECLFNVKAGEFMAVYAPTVFRSLLYDPALLENAVNVIKNLKPHILLISEVEGEHNSLSFVNRFIEVLFYYSSFFDCLEVLLPSRTDSRRVIIEEVSCGSQIKNMIAYEGESRKVRHVKMDKWRSFFQLAGLEKCISAIRLGIRQNYCLRNMIMRNFLLLRQMDLL